jgi:hypothetical protein
MNCAGVLPANSDELQIAPDVLRGRVLSRAPSPENDVIAARRDHPETF